MMKKTYQVPAIEVLHIQTAQFMCGSLNVYSDTEVSSSEILSREDDEEWDDEY